MFWFLNLKNLIFFCQNLPSQVILLFPSHNTPECTIANVQVQGLWLILSIFYLCSIRYGSTALDEVRIYHLC